MDIFGKTESVVNGRRKERKSELERCKKPRPNLYDVNSMYILNLEHEVIMLTWIMGEIDAVKRNHHSVCDEIVQKMYGSKN